MRLRTPLAVALALLGGAAALAQPSAVHKTELQRLPFPPPIYDTAMIRTVVDAGGLVAPHTHPGVEMAYIAHGQALVKIAGHDDLSLSSGGSFEVPPATVHSVRNTGTGPLTIVSTYVVDRTKPIARPAS